MENPRKFDNARMDAIKAYAQLEHSLALILKYLIGSDAETAWAIFFRIANTRSRYAIISDLLKLKHGSEYSKAWQKLEKWLVPLDTTRNHLVHWVTISDTVVQRTHRRVQAWEKPTLKNPVSRFSSGPNSPSYSLLDLLRYHNDTMAMAGVISFFAQCLNPAQPFALREKFQQPITHPNPEAFLRHLRGEEP